jgi:methylase of polypeptide subunit release factors
MALVAGAKGIELHERLLEEAAAYLAPGGLLAMELGQGQGAEIRTKIETMPVYRGAQLVPDEAGIDRIVIIERAG